jgi:hypothetical protein
MGEEIMRTSEAVPVGTGTRPEPAAGDEAPGRVLAAAVIAGTGAAITVPLTRPGVGWFIGAALAAVALAAARRLSGRPSPGSRRSVPFARWPAGARSLPDRGTGWRRCFGVAALALTAMAGIRSAGWVVALCLCTAAISAVLAVARRSRWADRGLGPAETVTWAARGIALPGRVAAAHGLFRGVTAGAALLLVFGTLFVLADLDFRHAVRDVVPDLSLGRVAQGILLFTVGGSAVLVAARALLIGGSAAAPEPAGRRRLRRMDWVPALAMLDALFAWFIGVQSPRMFGGDRYVLEPGGPDFAVYARDGFFLLLVATALTLVVIGVVSRYAELKTWLDRALIGALCLLTVVVMASAAHRLALYAGAYGFTRARLTGAAAGAFLVVVLALVAVRASAAWLPRALALSAVLTVLGFAAVNPDGVVADTVIQRFEKDGHLDGAYLAGLSDDAVPALNRLPEPERSCLIRAVTGGLDHRRPEPWYAYTVGYDRAAAILDLRPTLQNCEGRPHE